MVEALGGSLVESHLIEYVELGFRSEEYLVGNASVLDVALGFLGDVARVPGVEGGSIWILYIAKETQGFLVEKGIDKDRIQIGFDQHITLVDGLETSDGRAVNAQAVDGHVVIQFIDGQGYMVEHPWEIGKLQVEVLNLSFFNEFIQFSESHVFCYSSWEVTSSGNEREI